MADILSTDEERVDVPVMGAGGAPSTLNSMATKAYHATGYNELMTGTATRVVKGAGQVILGGDRGSTGRPFSDAEHGAEIMRRSRDTIVKSRASSWSGAWETDDVVAGIKPDFWQHQRLLREAPALYHQIVESAAMRKNYAATIGKNFTGTNTNTAGTPYGLVPSTSGGFAE